MIASGGERGRAPLVLASASPRRFALLAQIGVTPDIVSPTHVDERLEPGERPRQAALRLAQSKAEACTNAAGSWVLGADTIVACGKRILPKADHADQAEACLLLLSGRTHDVFTGIAVRDPNNRLGSKLVETRVTFKRLSSAEIRDYLASGDWRGKAGGYAIQGGAGAFVSNISGSYSAVVGLPLYETMNLLLGMGFPDPRSGNAS